MKIADEENEIGTCVDGRLRGHDVARSGVEAKVELKSYHTPGTSRYFTRWA